jgi:hypothetical protein
MPHPLVLRIAALVAFFLVLTLVLWRRRQRS